MIIKILRNIASILTGHVLSKALSFFCVVFLARQLGVEKFGLYGSIIAYLTLFAALADYGMTTVTVREVAQDRASSDFYFSYTLLLRFMLTGVAYGLFLLLASRWLPGYTVWFVASCGLFLFPEALRKSAIAFLSAYERMDLVATIQVLATVFRYIPFLVAVVLGKSLHIAFLGFFVSWSCFSALSQLITQTHCSQGWVPPYNIREWGKILYEAFPFGLLFVLSIIYFKVDIIMLSKMKGSVDVGLYEAAYKFIEALMFVPVSVVQVLLPAMSRTFVEDKSSYGRLYTHSSRILAAGILPFVILGAFFSREIILLTYTPDYLSSSPALSILVWALFLIFLKAPIGNIIATSKKVHSFLPYGIGNTVLNIVLNFLLIPKYGFLGASATTVFTECTGLAIELHFVNRVLGNSFSMLKITGKLLIAGAGASLVLYATTPYLIFPLNVIIFLGVYLGGLFIVKAIREEDVKILKTLGTMVKDRLSKVLER